MRKFLVLSIVIFLVITGCHETPKSTQFPVWKITSKSQNSTSFLVGTSNYFTRDELNKFDFSLIKTAYDSSSCFVSFFDHKDWIFDQLQHALLKNKINSPCENKLTSTLSSIVLPKGYGRTSKRFKVLDYFKSKEIENTEAHWLKKSLSQKKMIKGLINRPEYYDLISNIETCNKDIIQSKESFLSFTNDVISQSKMEYTNRMTNSELSFLFENKSQENEWRNKLFETCEANIFNELQNENCFVLINNSWLGELGFQSFLLSKGYSVEQIQ